MAPKTNFINPSPLACFFRLQSHPKYFLAIPSRAPSFTHSNSHQMSSLPETSLSILSQSNSPSAPWSFPGILLFTIFAAVACIYYLSPARLTRVLVSVLADVENAYLAGVENGNGVLSTDADVDVAGRLSVLQLKVSTLRETSLRNSVSPLSACFDMFNICHSVAVLRCLAEVRGLRIQIEISNESRLCDITSASQSRCQCSLANRASISLRRRGSPRSL
ncbi:hypothetical protein MSAN_02473900 [Mycena sanguinolenta]|uniref:Uncharacterized protein n=1 Tax=Mycena sanguinolenta TaxID=230812 RepID=A0A8H6WTX0_9AGAR|nr:hypothetical protein MSAN_02473900 [Mycena sanguinolenta]